MSSREAITINTDDDRAKVARWASQTGLGTVVEFRKKGRSVEQNAKMHAMLNEVASQVVWYGKELKVEDWKNMFTASLRKAQVVPGIDPGTVVPLGIHTSSMTIDEMSNMIELIYHFGAQPEHPVIFKEPPSDAVSPAPSVDSDEPVVPEINSSPEPSDTPALKSAGSLSPEAWLLNVARMLWAAAIPGGDLDVLKNQKKAALLEFPKPEDCPALIAGKANSIFEMCKQVVETSIEKPDALAMVAGIAGVDQPEILKQAELPSELEPAGSNGGGT